MEFSRSLWALPRISLGPPKVSKLLLLLPGVFLVTCEPNSVESCSYPVSEASNEARCETPQVPIGLTPFQDWLLPGLQQGMKLLADV